MSPAQREAKKQARIALGVRVAVLLDEGLTNAEIQKRLGIGYTRLLMIKRERGLLRNGGFPGANKRPNAKLNDAKVRAIRKLRTETGATYEQLGLLFGVSRVTAWKVCNGWWSGVE